MPLAWDPEVHRAQRRFRGLAVTTGHLRGTRVEGSVDEFVAALDALDVRPAREPVENGAPSKRFLGIVATLGSPWLDVLDGGGGEEIVTDGMAAALSRLGVRVLRYDYAFDAGRLSHRLFVDGEVAERLDVGPDDDLGTALGELDERYETWRMRDWGIDVEAMLACRLPVPAQLVVEAWLLDMEAEGLR
jgi:hypothetical protein